MGVLSKGAVALADALKVCTRISSPNLSNNSMGDAGVKEFAYHTLRINSTSLTLLDHSSNSIGFDGIRALSDFFLLYNFSVQMGTRRAN